ncbi:MAG: DMT family transporter [bacterium]|nr:DMT family transporter [bacterium]
MVVFLALTSAFFIGLSNVLIRKGLDRASRMQAIIFSLFSSVAIFWTLVFLFGDARLLVTFAIAWFLLAGLLGPGIGRALNITSLQRIGLARTIPIVGIAPFFATIVAIGILGEHFSFLVFFGMASIIFGIFVLSKGRIEKKEFRKRDILLPLGSALFGGFSIAITKRGLQDLQDPLGGAAIVVTMALLVALLYVLWSKQVSVLRASSFSDIKFSLLAGVSLSAAFLLNFSALQMGEVSIVAPLMSTFPMFGVLLGSVFLKERITQKMFLGMIFILAGVSFIQLL